MFSEKLCPPHTICFSRPSLVFCPSVLRLFYGCSTFVYRLFYAFIQLNNRRTTGIQPYNRRGKDDSTTGEKHIL